MWQKTICNGKVTFTIDIYQLVTGGYSFHLLHEKGKTEQLASMPTFASREAALDYIQKKPEWVEKQAGVHKQSSRVVKPNYECPGWRCPSCGAVVTLTDKDEAPDYCYKCPACGAVTGADEWEEVQA